MTSAEIILAHGVKPSILRVMIFDYLDAHHTHPTVDEVYENLLKSVPTLSKTSVYNNLKLMSKNGLVKEISIDSEKSRYDGNVNLHGHFMCSECKKVFDFDVEGISFSGLDGFTVETDDVYFTGKCKKCSEKI